MPNDDQVRILELGISPWNEWRQANPNVKPDLSDADLRGLDVARYDHDSYLNDDLARHEMEDEMRAGEGHYVNILEITEEEIVLEDSYYPDGFDLRNANLEDAQLDGACFVGANFAGANLERVSLDGSDLTAASLEGANLDRASLQRANLRSANLTRANLTQVDLEGANLSEVRFDGTVIVRAYMGSTFFANNDLSKVIGMDQVSHYGPSSIGMDTLSKSKGLIPETFLKGCGLNDFQIEFSKLYRPDLDHEEVSLILYEVNRLRLGQSIQISPMFISYSHEDAGFVDRVQALLDERGIRFWRDTEHATAGPLEKQVERAMRINPTVLLVLSKASVESDWVEHEVLLARALEKEKKKHVLCPVALDNSWQTCSWEERLKEQIIKYNILDFSNWQDEAAFTAQFNKLIEGLQLFYN